MLTLTEITTGNQFQIYAIGDEGQNPTHDFLQTISTTQPNELAKLLARLDHIADNGPPKNKEQCRKLQGVDEQRALFEVKTRKLRLFWFYDQGNLIICANGILKGKAKAQNRGIAAARKWQGEYFAAKENNEVKIIGHQ